MTAEPLEYKYTENRIIMIRNTAISIILLLIVGCNSKSNSIEHSTKLNIDSLKSIRKVILLYNIDSQRAEDSITKYQLKSLKDTCEKYIYLLYSSDSLNDKRFESNLTIGECNIKPIKFEFLTTALRRISFHIFINDSIPANIIVNTRMGQMLGIFDIDIFQKKIKQLLVDETGSISFDNIKPSIDSARKSQILKDYIKKYDGMLNQKFKTLIRE